MMPTIEINHIFTNFVAIDFISNNIPDIEKFCYDLHSKDQGRSLSNVGGWQSNDINLAQCLPKLFYDIKEKLDNLYYYFEFKDEFLISMDNAWININKKNHYNLPHHHSYGLFSGVYYVKAEGKNIGDVVFLNPCVTQSVCISEHIIKTKNPFNSSSYTVTPKTGMILIFPSWMMHYTNPNETDKDRISIAFNCYIK
jgi:uncharacterized protein (TIGR02466 family)